MTVSSQSMGSANIDSDCYYAWLLGREIAGELGKPLVAAGVTDLDVLFTRVLEQFTSWLETPRGLSEYQKVAFTQDSNSAWESLMEGLGVGTEQLLATGRENVQ